PLRDGLLVSPHPPLSPFPALLQKVGVQFLPATPMRHRYQKVPPGVAHQSFQRSLVVALARTPELLREQIVALQLTKRLRLLPLTVAQDLGHRQLRVVVQNSTRHSTEVVEGPHM